MQMREIHVQRKMGLTHWLPPLDITQSQINYVAMLLVRTSFERYSNIHNSGQVFMFLCTGKSLKKYTHKLFQFTLNCTFFGNFTVMCL